MHLCVHVCMCCVHCMYESVSASMHLCVHVCMCCVHCMYESVSASMHLCVHLCMCCVHVCLCFTWRVRVQTHAHVCTCTRTLLSHSLVYMRACTLHVYMHAHTFDINLIHHEWFLNIDYCNGLFAEIEVKYIERVQWVFGSDTGLILGDVLGCGLPNK